MDRNREFAGKTALVSGAGSGIGAAIARLLAQLGARVAVADIDLAAADATVTAIHAAGGEAAAFTVDVADADSQAGLHDAVAGHFGALHLAVNNAGIGGPRLRLEDYPLDDWRKVVDVDLNGVFYALRRQIPIMRAQGGGAIVNIASVASTVGIPLTGPYAAAKHGVVGLTRVAALENADANIRVNAVGPGYVETPLILTRAPEIVRAYEERHPVKRMARAEEIAEQVAFLLSDRASFVTGAFHLVDGGYTAQ